MTDDCCRGRHARRAGSTVRARTLPWRSDPDPWGVLVSEVMLQQTPVVRVLPVYDAWMQRWPTPARPGRGHAGRRHQGLGAARLSPARPSAARRRGRVLETASTARCRPTSPTCARLPGVGEYTAAAVAAFAFGQRHAVLDTNVRRVHARWLDGVELPTSGAMTSPERQRALDLLPVDPPRQHARRSPSWSSAPWCARRGRPRATRCPIADECAWRAAGYPQWDGATSSRADLRRNRPPVPRPAARRAPRRPTDRCRKNALDAAWADAEQRERALASLLADGLVVNDAPVAYRLPG